MLALLAKLIIERAKKTPYRKGHLLHADGSTYMERYALFETKWLSARVHHIATEDKDKFHHDHPWMFFSWVMLNGYTEARPKQIEPCFLPYGKEEESTYTYRSEHYNRFVFRRPTDRHRVVFVRPGTWTLFIYGPIRQWWGFYTPQGKVYFKDYISLCGRSHVNEEATGPGEN